VSKQSRRRGATPAPRKGHDVPPARTAAATALMAEAGMTKTRLVRSISRHRAPSRREITKPTIFDLYEQVRDIVSPLELELRYAELDELVSQLVDIMWTFVGALARAWIHGRRLGSCRTILPPRPRRAVLTGKYRRRVDRVGTGHGSSAGHPLPTQRRLPIDDDGSDAYAERMVLSRLKPSTIVI
jgi:hypothetical protein